VLARTTELSGAPEEYAGDGFESESGVGADYQHLRQRATRGEGNRDERKSFSLRASVGKTHHGRYMQTACQGAGNFQNSCNSVCRKGLGNVG